jgi:hypothetical protein
MYFAKNLKNHFYFFIEKEILIFSCAYSSLLNFSCSLKHSATASTSHVDDPT